MKIKLSELRKLIREECGSINTTEVDIVHDLAGDATDQLPGRDLGYGEGEGRMTRSQLDKIARYAQHLHDTLRDSDDLPEWVQDKITTSEDRISSAHDYIDYKIRRTK